MPSKAALLPDRTARRLGRPSDAVAARSILPGGASRRLGGDNAPAPAGEPEAHEAGFTLIEMLVTLAILALAVTFGARSIVVAHSARQPARVAATLAAELDRLRAEALRSGTTGRLAYDPDAGRFLSSRPGAPTIPAEALQVAVEVPSSGRPVPDEIRLLPDGSASGGRILLLAPRGGATVTVAPLTGRVRWEARS